MTKKILNKLIKLDIKDTKIKLGFFDTDDTDKNILITTTDDSKTNKIKILETKCYFGGYRYWFSCPGYKEGNNCGSRVRIIYRDNGVWGCRRCMNLTYKSQNLSGIDKLFGVDVDLSKIKKFFHGGMPTKKYRRYLNKEEKNTEVKNQILLSFSKKIEKKMEKLNLN